MPKSNFLDGLAPTPSQRYECWIENLREISARGESTAFPNLQADRWKAYCEFDICHSLPDVIGPVQRGNLIGYFPSALEASHGSMLHQQFNLRHALKAYDKEKIPRDRIIGCVVATAFPRKPAQGWRAPGKQDGATAHIHAAAVIFKLAEGVNKVLGDHLTERTRQSVSMEATTHKGNIGLYRPSTDQICPVLDPPEEWLPSLTFAKGDSFPTVGQIDGEKLVVIYGMGEPVEFQGVAMTPRPAELAAQITSVMAEEYEICSIAAEAHPMAALEGREFQFRTGRWGQVEKVFTEGMAWAPGCARIRAHAENPMLACRIKNTDERVLLSYETLAKELSV